MRPLVWGWLNQAILVGEAWLTLCVPLGSWLAQTRGMSVAVVLRLDQQRGLNAGIWCRISPGSSLHTRPLWASGSSFPRNWEGEKCMSGELVTSRFPPALLEVKRALLVLECQFLSLVSQLFPWNTDTVGTPGLWEAAVSPLLVPKELVSCTPL